MFYGEGLLNILERASALKQGGIVFGYPVKDPKRYGVLDFDADGKVVGIEEKPSRPKSRYAVTGLYFYYNKVVDIATKLTPSDRGELEITDVNLEYLKRGELSVEILGRGFSWLDTGTYDSLQQAASYVQAIQERQGLKVACIEEIAYRQGFIDKHGLKKLAGEVSSNEYGEYMQNILLEDDK